MTEPILLDATAQAELVRRKEVKPIELVDAAIERIERLNPKLNAVITPMFDLARQAALGPLPQGPFTGVPYLLKDLLASYGGVRLCMGTAFLKDNIADHDSILVSRLKAAGLIVVAKTNTPEFGILPTTEPFLFGATHNPWDLSRTPGGSSGGSAAAVASGMVAMAHGNDGGGSIRIPASCCGLFGLKPTRGRISLGPDLGDIMGGLVNEHALTRSVRDSAALLDATCGPAPGDPYFAAPPARPYLEEVGTDPGKLRIAFSARALDGSEIDPDCAAAVRDAAALCASLGHHVEEMDATQDQQGVTQAFLTIWGANVASDMDAIAFLIGRAPTPDQFEPLTWALAEAGRQQTAPAVLTAFTILQLTTRQVAELLKDYDVWLTPTLGELPLPLGTLDAPPDNPLLPMLRSAKFTPFTPICNITGQPAMSVPLYWNAQGIPLGTHFVARYGEEATLFRLAAQLEQARPWADRHPPIWD